MTNEDLFKLRPIGLRIECGLEGTWRTTIVRIDDADANKCMYEETWPARPRFRLALRDARAYGGPHFEIGGVEMILCRFRVSDIYKGQRFRQCEHFGTVDPQVTVEAE